MKKNWFLIISILVALLCGLLFLIPKKPASKARLSIDGKIIKEFDLTAKENYTEIFSSYNGDITIEVKDNKIRFLSSDCPDKICVNTGFISNFTQTAVCMPNKAILEIIE